VTVDAADVENKENLVETVVPRLHASVPEPLGFGSSLEIRAFPLQRERGNLRDNQRSSLHDPAGFV
jgi:hypothetical protein